ncbi:MAG: hypothetical protein HZB38_04030, partial [Planctomycetes bacterium]|nr:hypothetical protein [Planctomycetota bacterium]
VLGVLAVAIGGFWWYRLRTPAVEKTEIPATSRVGWCTACKKDFTVQAAEIASTAAQGDKIQCPMCKKFEAKWGTAPENPSSGVIMP